jgi:hypothetical protein
MTLTKRLSATSSCAALANLKMFAGIVSWLRLPIYQVGRLFVPSFVLFRNRLIIPCQLIMARCAVRCLVQGEFFSDDQHCRVDHFAGNYRTAEGARLANLRQTILLRAVAIELISERCLAEALSAVAGGQAADQNSWISDWPGARRQGAGFRGPRPRSPTKPHPPDTLSALPVATLPRRDRPWAPPPTCHRSSRGPTARRTQRPFLAGRLIYEMATGNAPFAREAPSPFCRAPALRRTPAGQAKKAYELFLRSGRMRMRIWR